MMLLITVKQIEDFLKANNIEGEVVQVHDTLGNQQLFRVRVKGKIGLRKQKEIEQVIQGKFHTKVTDINFVNENLHYDFNGSHMLVYDIERKYNNILSAKLQVMIDDHSYGYEVLFDDMKGVVDWDREYEDISQEHTDDGTSRDFKGLMDMFNIDLKNHVNIDHHIKDNPKSSKNKRNKDNKAPEILVNYNQDKGLISYVLIKGLGLSNTAFSKLVQELAAQSLYVTYKKRRDETEPVPSEIFIGRNGGTLSTDDMVNLTKVLSKNGIDMSDYETVDTQNLSLLPASALIKSAIKQSRTDV